MMVITGILQDMVHLESERAFRWAEITFLDGIGVIVSIKTWLVSY